MVFSSNAFIKKPIAIYFICLLLSDSMGLFIGYIDMINREIYPTIEPSWLCLLLTKNLERLKDYLYAFTERLCLEWILYRILWLRVSTILLAILSIQRTRTFFSLSYHESRMFAFSACVLSFILAALITCMEWTHVYYDTAADPELFTDIYQRILQDNSSREFYLSTLNRHSNESTDRYRCLLEAFSGKSSTNQSACLPANITDQFQDFTKSLFSNGDAIVSEKIEIILSNLSPIEDDEKNQSALIDRIDLTKAPDFISQLLKPRSCQISISYSTWLKTYDFFNSVSFGFGRHTIAVFFGNALPSFIAVLANVSSIKVIYFSKSYQYLKESTRKNRRKRRLKSDLHAFLVILIESFLVILISWGIPILLTMYHCLTLYVVEFKECPIVKEYAVFFMSIDLFNSSTNCLLYSLSGKLFRRRLISLLKAIFVCGHGTLWNIKQHSIDLLHHPLDRQLSNNLSTNTNNYHHPQQDSYRHSGRLSSPNLHHQRRKLNHSMQTSITYNRSNGQPRNVSDDGSCSFDRTSDDYQNGKGSLSDIESAVQKLPYKVEPRKSSLSIRSYLLDKMRSIGSTSSASSKTQSHKHPSTLLTVNKPKRKMKRKLFTTAVSKPANTTDLSFSTSSMTGSIKQKSQRRYSMTTRYSVTKVLLSNTEDNPSIIIDEVQETLTSL
ncbi:unnamed protein product [Adineta ricciae]|uniref:Uncharacterized protein n=1 Tax=Adineta ricciae TaxID=249248 RepID=A0A814MSH8_ADIRI|nr:unnamed protein product [Adineta ricciae]